MSNEIRDPATPLNLAETIPPQESNPIRKSEVTWLAFLVVCLLTFHAVTIGQQCFFGDEFTELHIASQPAGEILMRPDSMPPLYPLLLKSWLAVTGDEQYTSARWLSVLFGTASVVALWWAVRDPLGAGAALASAAVLAFSPFQLYYSQLIRNYALFTLAAILAVGFFARGLKYDRWRDWIGWGAASVLGIFSHYYFVFVGITLFFILIVSRRGQIGWKFTGAVLATVLVASPVLISLQADFEFQKELRDPRPVSLAAIAYTYFSFFTGYTLGPSKPELQTLSPGSAARQALPWAIALAATLLPIVISAIGFLRKRRSLSVLAILCILPVLFAVLAGWGAGLNYHPRFVAWCVAPIAVVIGSGIYSMWGRPLMVIATISLAAISLIATGNRFMVSRYQFEDLRGTAKYLLVEVETDEPVFVISDYSAHLLNFYLEGKRNAIELPIPHQQSLVISDQESLTQAIESIEHLSTDKPYWLVYCRPYHGDPQGLLLKRLQERDGIAAVQELPGVVIYRSANK